MRLILVPPDFDIHDPISLEKTGTCSFAQMCRYYVADSRFSQGDILTALDLYRLLSTAKAGDTIVLQDDTWAKLCEVAKSPNGMPIPIYYSSVSGVRAILDAKVPPKEVEAA